MLTLIPFDDAVPSEPFTPPPECAAPIYAPQARSHAVFLFFYRNPFSVDASDLTPFNMTVSLTDLEAQETIDKKILELEATIRAFKTQRNSHSAFFKLPVEVMTRIFSECKRRYQESAGFHYYYPRNDGRAWLDVIRVCRTWHALIMNTPRLWSFVELDRVGRALEMIKRSKSAPLQVRCRNSPYETTRLGKAAEAVMSQISRVQELDIVAARHESLLELLRLNPGVDAPQLAVLRLQTKENTFGLPKDVFQRDMPSLRVLELTHGTFTSELPSLPRLEQLIIRWVLSGPGISISLLVQSLRNTPNIQEISIIESNLPPTVPPDQTSSLPHVSLPLLRNLTIQSRDINGSKIFDFIEYPLSTIINFTCQTALQGMDLASLQSVCSRFAVGGLEFRELVVVPMSTFRITLHTTYSAHLSIALPLPKVSAYVQLCSSLPLANIPSLILQGMTEALTEYGFLKQFKQVTRLLVSDCSHKLVRGLLVANVDGVKQLPLPRLRTVSFASCRFNLSLDDRDEDMCGVVLDLLYQRRNLEMPIQRLEIKECDITEDVVEEFRELVELDWDGYEIEESEEEDEYNDDDDDNYSVTAADLFADDMFW